MSCHYESVKENGRPQLKVLVWWCHFAARNFLGDFPEEILQDLTVHPFFQTLLWVVCSPAILPGPSGRCVSGRGWAEVRHLVHIPHHFFGLISLFLWFLSWCCPLVLPVGAMNGEGGDGDWLSGWEQQCSESIEEQPDYEQSLISESDSTNTRMWTAFQDSATSIAQLYRDRYTGEPATLWLQFQTAAGTVTSLYKESSEGVKRTSELARQSGYQKRNIELFNWAKRKRRLIRREDLLAYLSGKPPPPPTRQNHHHHSHHRPRNISPPPGVVVAQSEAIGIEPNLNIFREALARSHLTCVPRGGADLCAFITGEMARHCTKRPASPSDVTMGSPTQQKKPRYM